MVDAAQSCRENSIPITVISKLWLQKDGQLDKIAKDVDKTKLAKNEGKEKEELLKVSLRRPSKLRVALICTFSDPSHPGVMGGLLCGPQHGMTMKLVIQTRIHL